MDVMDRRKTMVIVIGHGKGRGKGGRGGSAMQKQRSWETFPPKRRQNGTKFCRDPDSFRGAFQATSLKKVMHLKICLRILD